jgi:hypothetical protein
MNVHTFGVIVETLLSFAVRAWSGVGPLVGVLIGAWLTRSWQRKQWVLEGKKAEYRELISTLSESFHCIVKNWPAGLVTAVSHETLRETLEAEVAGQRVVEDRIFIENQLRAAQIRDRWALLAAEHDYNRICTYWKDLHDTLVKMARSDLGIKE